MAVMRVKKNSNYTTMSNYHLDDKRLSLKAVGLLSKILRLPDNWDYSVAGLSKICNEGKAAITSAIKELEETGYITRKRVHLENGTFSGIEYIVYECPQPAEQPFTENQQMDKEPFTDYPSLDNPLMDYPSADNQPQISTNIPSTNIPPISPTRGARRQRKEPKQAPDWKPERFAAFWEVYPRGESKQAAIAAWDKLKANDDLLVIMGKALKRQMQSEEWQRGIGIPYASTWINKRRWEDEAKPLAQSEPERRYDVWT